MKLRIPDFMTSTYHMQCSNGLNVHKDRAQSATMYYATVYFDVTTDLHGIHIARDGYLNISQSGKHNPDVRAIYQHEFGVGCDLATKFSGMLICPHTGKDVKVSRIEGNPVLWLDYEYGIAVKSLMLRYATPTSPPEFIQTNYNTGRNKLRYSFANQKRYNAFKKHWLSLQPEAQLRYDIMQLPQVSWPRDMVKELVLDIKELVLEHPEATTLEQLCDLAAGIEGFASDDFLRMCQVVMTLKTWDVNSNSDQAKLMCADRYETTYFKIKEAK